MPTVTITVNGNGTSNLSVMVNPPRVKVPAGTQTLTWNLAGSAGAKFTSNGISFSPSSGWPYGAPSKKSDAQFQIGYNNNAAKVYDYTLEVTVGGLTLSIDPEVDNQPPP